MADDERKRPADAVDLTKDASPEKKQKVTRTVNGTGHTGTSEFCATSI